MNDDRRVWEFHSTRITQSEECRSYRLVSMTRKAEVDGSKPSTSITLGDILCYVM